MELLQQSAFTEINDRKQGKNGYHKQNGYHHRKNGAGDKREYDLAAQISHQILSSATKVQAVLYALADMKESAAEEIPEEVFETLPLVFEELRGLGEEVLHLNTTGSSQPGFSAQRLETTALIEEAIQPFLLQAPERRLLREYQPRLPRVWGSAQKLRIVLDNLMSNALKYSTPGSPIIIRAERRLEELETLPEQAVISITNFGSYVPPEEKEKIFTKFYRSDHTYQPGQGVGLYLSRCLVEMHGGRLEVDSRPSRETTFWFTLPLASG